MKNKPVWNVWIWNFNADKLEPYNVMPILINSYKKLKKKDKPQTLNDLDVFLRNEARYYFWAKCEYEMIIHSWPALKREEKVDVYDQLQLNWNEFVKYFWTYVISPKTISCI